jgi:hypothetical protein
MNLIQKIKNIFTNKNQLYNQRRLNIEDIKSGDMFLLDMTNIKVNREYVCDGIGVVTCINNDQLIRQIYITTNIIINKQTKETITKDYIFCYSDKIFRNLNLLNPNFFDKESDTEINEDSEHDILQKALDLSVKKEYFEIAEEINEKLKELQIVN